MVGIEKEGIIDIVTFNVEKINALNIEEIKGRIVKTLESSNSRLLINLSGVEYIDSSGFGCFLFLMKVARNNYGILKFCSLSKSVMTVFEALHLHSVFEIYPDKETGIKSF